MYKKRGRPRRKASVPAKGCNNKKGRKCKTTRLSDKEHKNKNVDNNKNSSDEEGADEPSDSGDDFCSDNEQENAKKKVHSKPSKKSTKDKTVSNRGTKSAEKMQNNNEDDDNDDDPNGDDGDFNNDDDDSDNNDSAAAADDDDDNDGNGDDNTNSSKKQKTEISSYKNTHYSKGTYYILDFKDKNRRPIALQNKRVFLDTTREFERSLKSGKAVILKYETKKEAQKNFKEKMSVFDKKNDEQTTGNKQSSTNQISDTISPEQQKLLDKMLANVSKFSRGPVLQLLYYYRTSTNLLVLVIKFVDSDRNEVWSFKNTAIAPSIQTWYSIDEHNNANYQELIDFLEPATFRDPHGKPEDAKLSPKRPNSPNAKRWPLGGIWTHATIDLKTKNTDNFIRSFGEMLLATMRETCFRPLLKQNMIALNFGGMWEKLNEKTKGPTLWTMLETATVQVDKIDSYDDLDKLFLLSDSQKIDSIVNPSQGFA